MAQRSFHCRECGAQVEADDADQSQACPDCGAWFHATACARCAEPYLAVGIGRQECPRCGLRKRFDERSVTVIGDVADPLDDHQSVARGRVAPTVDRSMSFGPMQGDPLAATISTVLWIGSAVVAVAGIVAVVVVLVHVHRDVAAAVAEIVFATAVSAAVLAALAYLVERADEHSMQLGRIARHLEGE